MTGILRFGVALPGAVLTLLSLGAGFAGVVDWGPAASAAVLFYLAALVSWRISRSRAAAEKRRAELEAISIRSERRAALASRRAA